MTFDALCEEENKKTAENQVMAACHNNAPAHNAWRILGVSCQKYHCCAGATTPLSNVFFVKTFCISSAKVTKAIP